MRFFGYNISKVKEKRNTIAHVDYYTPYGEALHFGQINTANYSSMNLSAVYRAVEIISDSIAILPISIKDKTIKHNESIDSHPVNNVLKGNDYMSKYNFIKLLIQSVLLKGNGFAFIDRANDNTPLGLYFLENSDVQVHYNKLKRELYYTCNLLPNKRIEPKNMIHLKKNSYDGVNGISTISFAARTLNIASNTENSASSFFEKGCNLAGILTVQGQLTDQQRQDIRSSWRQAYTDGGSGLAILQGNMNYDAIQLNAADSQLLESRLFNVQDIARFFGISPVLLGDLSHSSYSTIEATQNQFLLHTLQPYIVMIEEEFTRKLLDSSENNIIVNFDETYLLKTDKAATANYYKTLLDCGVLCANEVRKELGYSEVEGLDKHIIAFTDISQNTINEDKEEDKNTKEEING